MNEPDAPAAGRQRLDKWLWFARLVRTRTLAQKLAAAGRVRINRVRTDSPSHAIRIGDVLTVTLESGVRVLKVLDTGERRGPAPEARLLYDDLAPPEARAMPAPSGPRPTKRDRRALDAFRNDDSDG
jgi:ribosome-associated heat shock protein Hsp15